MSSPSGSKRIALITGASSGIGRTSAIALARTNQWKICLSGRREEELEKTAKLCREAADEAQGGQDQQEEDLTLIVAGDVSKEDNVERLFSRVKEVYGKPFAASCLSDIFRSQTFTSMPYSSMDLDLFRSRSSGYALQRKWSSPPPSSRSVCLRPLHRPVPCYRLTECRDLDTRNSYRRPFPRHLLIGHEHQRHGLCSVH